MVALFAIAFLLTYLLTTANANPLHPTNQVGQMVDMLFETFGIDIIDHSARALDLKGDDVLKVNTTYLFSILFLLQTFLVLTITK